MNITTKYNIGDEVWVIHNNIPMKIPVNAIHIRYEGEEAEGNRIIYDLNISKVIGDTLMDWVCPYNESRVFKTKEDLIASL